MSAAERRQQVEKPRTLEGIASPFGEMGVGRVERILGGVEIGENSAGVAQSGEGPSLEVVDGPPATVGVRIEGIGNCDAELAKLTGELGVTEASVESFA